MTYAMHDLLQDMASGGVPLDDKILAYLSVTDTRRLKELLARLQIVRHMDVKAIAASRAAANAKPNTPRKHTIVKQKGVEGAKSRIVGMLFERIVQLLCDGCEAFTAVTNVRTSTAEVDVLIQLGPTAALIPMLRAAGSHMLGEAKCYTSGMKTEWVNELVGIMEQHNCDHSVLFVASPSKTLNVEHRHGLQLHAKGGKMIVPFGLKQLMEIANGSNFLSVLSRQYVSVKTGATSLAI
jgi:hypothetical protein